MSSFEVEQKKQLDMLVISEKNYELFELLTEYLKLKNNYQEPKDAMKMREKAEECLKHEFMDCDKAYSLMKIAMKIMKACNGLKK